MLIMSLLHARSSAIDPRAGAIEHESLQTIHTISDLLRAGYYDKDKISLSGMREGSIQ
jgi:hypothetical protein